MAANIYQSIQGNMGLGKAIEYFTSQGYPVCLPLNDTQKYDLIVDMHGFLYRVQVKTSRRRASQSAYLFTLCNTGGSSGKHKMRPFSKRECDLLFLYDADDRTFLVPTRMLDGKNNIAPESKYNGYEVFSRPLSQYAKEIQE